MTIKTTEALILKMHIAADGAAWYADGIDVPRMATEGRRRFINSLSNRETLHVRVLGTLQNAQMIVQLYKQYCSPGLGGTLEVASPLVCPAKAELDNPEVALYRMRQCLLPASLGGWHPVSSVDYPSYAIADSLIESGAHFCDRTRELLPTHPVWHDLLFIPTISPPHVTSLIVGILDPRWFVDQRRPERLAKLKMALGLTPANMRRTHGGGDGSVASRRCRTVLDCWKSNGEPSAEDMERPGNFLWRRWRHEGGGCKGDLRASQDFVSYMVRTWQQQIVTAAGLSIDMFLPASLLRNQEIDAYNAHAARRPINLIAE